MYACTVAYTGQVTIYKELEKHGHVSLVGLYVKSNQSVNELNWNSIKQNKKINFYKLFFSVRLERTHCSSLCWRPVNGPRSSNPELLQEYHPWEISCWVVEILDMHMVTLTKSYIKSYQNISKYFLVWGGGVKNFFLKVLKKLSLCPLVETLPLLWTLLLKFKVQGDQWYMTFLLRYLVKRDLSCVRQCTVDYSSVTFNKVPDSMFWTHGLVYLVGLWRMVCSRTFGSEGSVI